MKNVESCENVNDTQKTAFSVYFWLTLYSR